MFGGLWAVRTSVFEPDSALHTDGTPYREVPALRKVMDGMRVLSGRMLQAGLLGGFAGLALFARNSTDPVSAASAALRSRRFADALQILQPVLQKDPENKQLWMLQGLAYLGQEKKTDALTSFRTALKISPDYLPA